MKQSTKEKLLEYIPEVVCALIFFILCWFAGGYLLKQPWAAKWDTSGNTRLFLALAGASLAPFIQESSKWKKSGKNTVHFYTFYLIGLALLAMLLLGL